MKIHRAKRGSFISKGPFPFGIIGTMKLRALTLAVILALVIAGCSTVSISSSPTPEPTDTPVTAQAWAPLPPLPTPRTAAAVAVADGRVYVMGGLDELGRPSRKVEVFNPRDKGWSVAASLPEAVYDAAAVGINGEGLDKILLFGGLKGRRGDISSAAYQFDAYSNAWSEVASLPSPRAALAATVYGGRVYVIGGVDENAVSSSIDIYDPESNSWRRGPSLQSGRSHMSAVTVGKLIYVIGGKDDTGSASLDLAETLDPTSGAWAEVQGLEVGRADLGALEYNGRVYVMGGENIDMALDSVQAFDPKFARWLTFPPLPLALHGAATANVDGIGYVIGGSAGPGLSVVGDAYAIVLQ